MNGEQQHDDATEVPESAPGDPTPEPAPEEGAEQASHEDAAPASEEGAGQTSEPIAEPGGAFADDLDATAQWSPFADDGEPAEEPAAEDMAEYADPAAVAATVPHEVVEPTTPWAPVPPVLPSAVPQAVTADAGVAVAERAPRKGRKGLILTLVGLLVVALGVGGWFWWDATMKAQREQAIRDTATAYLTAIAGADAAAALSALAEPPADATLLTPAVLQDSAAAAPLTDIVVGTVTAEGTDGSVDVSYAIGGEAISTALRMSGDNFNAWKIVGGTADLTVNQPEGITVNGVAVTGGVHPVLPGTYLAVAPNRFIAVHGTTTAFVPSPGFEGATIAPEYALSEAGTQGVFETVKARFDVCLASTETLPSDCPFGVDPVDATVTPGSVRFVLNNDPWAGFAPTLDVAAQEASGLISFDITAYAEVTYNGITGQVQQPIPAERGWTVDLSAEPLTVSWK